MSTLDLRSIYRTVRSKPRYVLAANALSDEAAAAIAAVFGDSLEDVRADLDQANEYAATARTRPDARGQGMGMFLSAEALFWGYLYEMHREAACASAAAERHELQGDE